MLGKCSALKVTFRNLNLSYSTLWFYMHFFNLFMTKKKKVCTLNSEVDWFVWFRRQKSVSDFYCISHFSGYVQGGGGRGKERGRGRWVGNESTWLPNIQDVANNVCSPLQRQGAYIHIGYSLWTTELLFAYFKWNPNVPSTARILRAKSA